MFTESPYQGYAYAYPHKTAYRPLEPAENLAAAWADEDKSALFLYFHIPFCEMRCGYCNLFTIANPGDDLVDRYLDQLDVQVNAVMEQLGRLSFARLAIGGGTPTRLNLPQLERLFALVRRLTRQDVLQIPASVETSPQTATLERLAFLKESGVSRISIGVQSFIEDEVCAAGRSQRTHQVYTALDVIRQAEIPTLNIDLIYGLPGQTPASWQQSLQDTLRWQPEEIYLYPLYVRPLTGLDGRQQAGNDNRQELLRQARDYLLAQGYVMRSMRLFQRKNAPQTVSPPYSCQEDGMVGFGCGARSYTRALHYSSEWAVSRGEVLSILRDYLERPRRSFDAIHYGIRLSADDQHRRYVIKSLLRSEGMDRAAYRAYFAQDVLEHLPELEQLVEMDLATINESFIRLTSSGLEYTDVIGPFLYSKLVRDLIEQYDIH